MVYTAPSGVINSYTVSPALKKKVLVRLDTSTLQEGRVPETALLRSGVSKRPSTRKGIVEITLTLQPSQAVPVMLFATRRRGPLKRTPSLPYFFFKSSAFSVRKRASITSLGASRSLPRELQQQPIPLPLAWRFMNSISQNALPRQFSILIGQGSVRPTCWSAKAGVMPTSSISDRAATFIVMSVIIFISLSRKKVMSYSR